ATVAAEAQAMLMSLSGRCHQVMTAIALVGQGIEEVMCVTTDVEFRELTANDCARYWATGEPVDKAGGYGIQGFGAVFVSGIKGSYSGVVGLPLAETAQLLSKYNIPVWQSK
ncbi:MAG: Maf family protein, partial [Pontibacterium sp.]